MTGQFKLQFNSYLTAENKKSELEDKGHVCSEITFINPFFILWIKDLSYSADNNETQGVIT